MTTDTSTAFADLDARADADNQSDPSDRISLRNHTVDVEIGAFQVERGTTQRVCFNVVVEVRSDPDLLNDDVDRILSYDTITDAITYALAEERLDLLETLAERVAERILISPLAVRVFVRIEKLDRGPGALGVEIVRARENLHFETGASVEKTQPKVVYFGNDAIMSPHLKGWIDQLENTGMPVVICVGIGSASVPHSSDAIVQQRINMLVVEQNAWLLAGLDHRCVVTSSRTEIDWANQNNQISIWAPSKIVLDSTGSADISGADPIAQALWFGNLMGAASLTILGSSTPHDAYPNTIIIPASQAAAF